MGNLKITAEKFATVSNGKVVSVTDSYPAHELLPNQFALTPKEYYLLQRFPSWDEIYEIIKDIEEKILGVSNGKSG